MIFSRPHWRSVFLSYAQQLLQSVVVTPTLQQPESPLWRRIQLYYRILAPLLVEDRFFPLDLDDCGGFDAWYALQDTQFAAYVDERIKTFVA